MRNLLCLLFCVFLLCGTAQGKETLLPPPTDDEIRDMSQVGRTMQILLQDGWDRFEPELNAEDKFFWVCMYDRLSLVPEQSDWRGFLRDLLTMESAEDYRAILRKPYPGIIESLTGGNSKEALAAAERVFQAASTDKILPYRFFYAWPHYGVVRYAWSVYAGDGAGSSCLLWLDADLRLEVLEDGNPWHGHWSEELTQEQTGAALAAAENFSETVWPGMAEGWSWRAHPYAMEDAADEQIAIAWAGDKDEGILVGLGIISGRVYYSSLGYDEETYNRQLGFVVTE